MFGDLLAAIAAHQSDILNRAQRTLEFNPINSSRTLGSKRA